MKFTIATSYFLVAAATFAVLSIEATSLRGEVSLSLRDLSTNTEKLDDVSAGLRRRVEENEDQSDDNVEENDDGNDDGNDDANDDANDEANDDAGDETDDAAQGDDEDAGDDYVFYDDVAIQNCEDGDEDCALAATYEAYDEETLANCEDDDEECNSAAAFMAAKQAREESEEEGEETDLWDLNSYTDKYKSMSRSTQIWTIVLAVWFATLFLSTLYICCCRKGHQQPKKKALRESLMGGTSRRS